MSLWSLPLNFKLKPLREHLMLILKYCTVRTNDVLEFSLTRRRKQEKMTTFTLRQIGWNQTPAPLKKWQENQTKKNYSVVCGSYEEKVIWWKCQAFGLKLRFEILSPCRIHSISLSVKESVLKLRLENTLGSPIPTV